MPLEQKTAVCRGQGRLKLVVHDRNRRRNAVAGRDLIPAAAEVNQRSRKIGYRSGIHNELGPVVRIGPGAVIVLGVDGGNADQKCSQPPPT